MCVMKEKKKSIMDDYSIKSLKWIDPKWSLSSLVIVSEREKSATKLKLNFKISWESVLVSI